MKILFFRNGVVYRNGIAIGVVNQIQSRFESLSEESTDKVTTSTAGNDSGDHPMNEEEAMVERMLGKLTKKPEDAIKIGSSTADSLAIELRRYQDTERFRADTNISEFWKNQKLSFPLLSNIALTIL